MRTSRQHTDFTLDWYDIAKIADSGQCFRWKKIDDNAYFVPVLGENAIISQAGSLISLDYTGDIAMWKKYLSVDEDYRHIASELSGISPAMDNALSSAEGIRVLHQPIFEIMISFIISQNNNIPRISSSIAKLCRGDEEPFPSANEILELLDGDNCGLGYRKEYIESACRLWNAGELDWMLEASPLDMVVSGKASTPLAPEDRELLAENLLSLKGVGPKVAACISLFGFGDLSSVPRDVWIKRAEQEHEILWHPEYSGIQQQFVFYAIRKGKI